MLASKHHPNGGATAHCDNGRIESLIAQYKANGDLGSLSEIVSLSQNRALALIRFYRTTRYRPTDELLSDVNLKLIRAVGKFDPQKGTAFSFVSHVVLNTLRSSVSSARRDTQRHCELTEGVLSRLITTPQDNSALEDIQCKVRTNARTTLRDEVELSLARWFVESFVDDRFESHRHKCVNAAQMLFKLRRERLSEIHDLCVLEVRRVLLDDLPQRPEISPARLIGTRSRWAIRCAPLLDAAEFTKFVRLTKDLSPFVVYLANPTNKSRRSDRNPKICREDLLRVIHGDPSATPLFLEPGSLECRKRDGASQDARRSAFRLLGR